MKKIKEWKYYKEEIEKIKSFAKKLTSAANKTNKRFRWNYKGIGDVECAQNDWNQTLMTVINQANKDFGGTGLIVSNEAAVIIEDLAFFDYIIDTTANASFYKFGTLNGMIVYKDSYLPAHIILIIKDDFFTSDNPDCVVIIIDGLPTF